MDAIDAAARAIWARRNPNRKEAFPRAGLLREVIFADARAAIAAYLEATGVERDAERYRWIRNGYPGFDERMLLVGEELDEAIDFALREEKKDAIDSARGGEHG